MARYRFYSVLQAMNGDVISGADISVYISGTNNPARVYLVKEGGDPVDEPPQLQSDASGRVEFWVDLVDYSPQTRFRIEAVKDGWSAVLDDVKIVEEDMYVYVQSSEPADKWIGVQWFDTSYSPPLLKMWNGSSWVVGGADVLDGAITAAKIADGAISTLHFASDAVAPNADKVDGWHASQTPTANTIPVADAMGIIANAWLANSIRGFENPVDPIAYYNQNGVDYPLAVGEVAKISFSAVTSQPLRIATPNDSEYLLWLIPSNTGGTSGGTAAPIYLYPNNTTYSDAFVFALIFRDSLSGSSSYVTYSAFRIGWAFSHIFCVIRNLQQYKNIMGFYDIYGVSAGFPVASIFSTDWRDTTTAWTSLGTIVWPQASSGYIFVKRIM